MLYDYVLFFLNFKYDISLFKYVCYLSKFLGGKRKKFSGFCF